MAKSSDEESRLEKHATKGAAHSDPPASRARRGRRPRADTESEAMVASSSAGSASWARGFGERRLHARVRLRRDRRRSHHARMPANATMSAARFAAVNDRPSVHRTGRRPPKPKSHTRPRRTAWGQPCVGGSYRRRVASRAAVTGNRAASTCMTLTKSKDAPNRASRSRAVAVVTTRVQRQREDIGSRRLRVFGGIAVCHSRQLRRIALKLRAGAVTIKAAPSTGSISSHVIVLSCPRNTAVSVRCEVVGSPHLPRWLRCSESLGDAARPKLQHGWSCSSTESTW